MPASLVYVTTSDAGEARTIGRAMVKARLAACANIVPAMQPIFWWDGEVQEGEESLLLLKTRQDLVEPLTTAIKKLHSYDCPCVVAIPISGGNRDFLVWIEAETTPR
ncbi:divalent-cation tolerance protein CutA [Pelagibius litoralis]|uniref:Divalent-cation tolerance protein CutA n=1 Tax=Pelagibius litoralis TaxID=374515 RepID=A0A967C2G1_9PROT|nr:divalent-cation tolerance protein CutA [Pelagibius litoralis]NIA67059.1 divalent-cation tolerance protein CutA [Pelagibius litoralis]